MSLYPLFMPTDAASRQSTLERILAHSTIRDMDITLLEELIPTLPANALGLLSNTGSTESEALEALIFESAISESPFDKPGWNPRIAAKHLLGLGEYGENDPSFVEPDTGLTLPELAASYRSLNGKVVEAIRSLDPLSSASLRRRIAAIASGAGRDRTIFNPSKSRIHDISSRLDNEISRIIASDEAASLLQIRLTWIRNRRKRFFHDGQIEEAVSLAAIASSQLDRSSGVYPTSMAPSNLAREMTITEIRSDHLRTVDDPQRLYSDQLGTMNGDSAVPRLLDSQRAVLLGDPGAGKSTIATGVFVAHVGRRLAGVFARLSILGELVPELDLKTPENAIDAVLAAAEATAPYSISPEVRKKYRQLAFDGSGFLIVLDGLDEVTPGISLQKVQTLFRLLDQTQSRILVTSRIAGYNGIPFEAEQFRVDRLNAGQVVRFIEQWFASRPGRKRLQKALYDSEEIADLMQIPVMAGFAAYVAETNEVSDTISRLYRQYLSLYLQRAWKDQGIQRADTEIGPALDAASELAWFMSTQPSAGPFTRFVWADTLSMDDLRGPGESLRDTFAVFTKVDGILTPHGSTIRPGSLIHRRYRWIHRTIHEHLSGARLADELKTDYEATWPLVAELSQQSKVWGQTLAHTMGALPISLQNRIFEDLGKLASDRDPSGSIRLTISAMCAQADPLSIPGTPDEHDLRTRLLRASRSGTGALDSALAELDFDSENSDLFIWTSLLASGRVRCSDTAIEAFLERAASHSELAWSAVRTVITSFGRSHPDSALNLVLIHFEKFPGLFGYFPPEWSDWSTSPEGLSTVFELALRSPSQLLALRFVTLLTHLSGGTFYLEERSKEMPFAREQLQAPRFLAERYFDVAGAVVVEERPLVQKILQGDFGDVFAYSCATMLLPVGQTYGYETCSWAEVGIKSMRLSDSNGPRREDFPTIDREAAANVLLFAVPADLEDSTKSIGILDALAAFALEPHLTHNEVLSVIHFWAFVGGSDVALWPPKVALERSQAGHIARIILDVQNWSTFWPAMREAYGFDSIRDNLIGGNPALASAIEREGDFERDRITDAIVWGAENNLPIWGGLPRDSRDPSVIVTSLVEKGLGEYLLRPEALTVLSNWLWNEGSLPYWRSRLRLHNQ